MISKLDIILFASHLKMMCDYYFSSKLYYCNLLYNGILQANAIQRCSFVSFFMKNTFNMLYLFKTTVYSSIETFPRSLFNDESARHLVY